MKALIALAAVALAGCHTMMTPEQHARTTAAINAATANGIAMQQQLRIEQQRALSDTAKLPQTYYCAHSGVGVICQPY